MTIYRGIRYEIAKGAHTRYPDRRMWWHATIHVGCSFQLNPNHALMKDAVKAAEKAIDIALDYGGDEDLYHLVEVLVHDVTRRHVYALKDQPSVREMCAAVDRACEMAKRIIAERHAAADRSKLASKFAMMTEEHGCTAAEATAAREKLARVRGAA